MMHVYDDLGVFAFFIGVDVIETSVKLIDSLIYWSKSDEAKSLYDNDDLSRHIKELIELKDRIDPDMVRNKDWYETSLGFVFSN